MSDYADLLEAEHHLLKSPLSLAQRALLVRYCTELERWNQKINLTGLAGRELVRRLVLEPVWVANELEIAGSLVDIGSGNGSPAIPMAIARRLDAVHLVEARAKRAVFLRHVASQLKIRGVTVHHGRLDQTMSELPLATWVTLQGIALTIDIIEDIHRFANKATRIVWMTAEKSVPSLPEVGRLRVPFTKSEVLIFQLDLP